MLDVLNAFLFNESHLPLVRHITCGPDWWSTEVAEWLHCTHPENSALEDIRVGVRVWLYENTRGEIVGFGSLGVALWPMPNGDDALIQVLPVLGLDERFHGKPAGKPPDERYSNRVINHLLNTAQQNGELLYLGLIVAPENTRAIQFYERFGFQKYGEPAEVI